MYLNQRSVALRPESRTSGVAFVGPPLQNVKVLPLVDQSGKKLVELQNRAILPIRVNRRKSAKRNCHNRLRQRRALLEMPNK